MSRPSFSHSLEVLQPYLSLVFGKIPGQSDWTLFNQGRVLTPDISSEEKQYSRIGDKVQKKVAGNATYNCTVSVYVEENLKELALILGDVRPGGGWAGTETIEFDPTVKIDLKVETYDGITGTSALLFTEYFNEFSPTRLSMNLEAEGDARMAEIQGGIVNWYIVPAAG